MDPERFGARVGIALVVAGFVAIFLGWNGAASVAHGPSQFPYLISGGLAGLALVVAGAALMIIQSSREDRAELRREISELRALLEDPPDAKPAATPASSPKQRVASGMVLAGPTTFHTASCQLIEGRGELPLLSMAGAVEQGLEPCRVCRPGAKGKASTRPQSTHGPRR